MQPYQKAAEELRKSGEYPIELLKNLGTSAIFGGGAKLGSSAIAAFVPKIAALINSHVPDNLSIKGLNKIDPRLGTFIDGALKQGYDYNEIRDFIKNKIEGNQEAGKQKAPDQRSIIEQYSPELYQFLKGEIDKGRAPLEAGALAQLQDPFKKIIKKMSDDHKAPFSSILQSVFGNGMQQSNQISTAQPMQTQSQNQQQSGGGDQALLAALDKILKM